MRWSIFRLLQETASRVQASTPVPLNAYGVVSSGATVGALASSVIGHDCLCWILLLKIKMLLLDLNLVAQSSRCC
jgi:hypothetical protein